MTVTYDPRHPAYLDEADVRAELTRVFDRCHDCRLCSTLCNSFPTLFSYVDDHEDHDAGRLTPAQQDQVIDECFQCKLCYVRCPYTPETHEWAIDFPRLMLRADAMRHATKQVTIRRRITTSVTGHADVLGRVATRVPSLSNAVIGARPGSLVRRVVAATSGVSSVRLLPPFARQRFSTWFKKRTAPLLSKKQGSVAVFPTCVVEYHEPGIGHDLVKVYERNGIECSMVDGAGCCGAPYLHGGDLDAFTKVAARQVTALSAAVREGKDIVVPQPTCSYVLKKDYVDYVGGPDAELVSRHTFDAAEYLVRINESAGGALDSTFTGVIPEKVTYHAPCHVRAQNIGLKSSDLMSLTGAAITVVEQCSGIDGTWGLKAVNERYSLEIAEQLAAQIITADGEMVTGDCHLANTAITEQTGTEPMHPLQMIARAYGIPEEA